MHRPDDLWEFWDRTRDELDAVAPAPVITPAPEKSSEFALFYHVRINSFGGQAIHCWYAMPPVSPDVQLAGLLWSPGYNGAADPIQIIPWVRRGYAVLLVIPRGQGDTAYPEGSKGKVAYNCTDRETYAYRSVYMDCLRGLQFLRNQPEVHPHRIAITGGSQGGGLTLATTALSREPVSVAAAHIPFIGSFDRVIDEQVETNPYCELTDYLRANPSHTQKARETLRYFDPLYLVDHIECPLFMTAGMKDERCPEWTIRPVFDQVRTKKQFLADPEMGHEWPEYVNELMHSWLSMHLR
jgi:cephalosporin-C deacetylase